ncbi:ketoacyl-ACP synthase III [Xenorhabdus nematophila]|uniref:3-oxoacyl-[acyl-carrier-protein] synthase III C-terminal domain-containing protein n=1 Tax=Xenorhabdus nematophila TaxID=628 RepID=UPI0003275646|nr:3-oxoacyl-[acyl-carrier-protein] synthase III C-terminal domain-containing protein [Xenorhabdus nematophila]CEF28608.1 putative 3-oxoacyl-(acyl-carrier-protein) synthase [Xenorhabdus nematophila str. Websteri]AYA39233.1 ketoacyl-ACP synthase III [Xenorhabdus nematophila]MBA0017813.1 ketoacyl-ACP synthase III [Xenorhabdus nematophila]MCB4426829.1 ketoacyl-ACP synthase III [Xenorhabdus nematophila]QNJ36877.1 ketoacyl-ACP synthase III [Xenorhabdus nematophila]
MRIIGISGVLPSRCVTNQDILELVEKNSKEIFQGDLTKTLKTIERLLDKTGIESRYWLGEDEKPMYLMEMAFNQALEQANIDKSEIDLLIYPNVTRGFTEPANSTFVAKALGLSCRNYDIADACNGWITAMDVINSKMKAGDIRYAAIINMEFGMSEDGPFAKNFSLNSSSELTYKYPSCTIGEAASVTILSNDNIDNFRFDYISRPDLCDLCNISLPDWALFCNESDVELISALGGKYQFNSYGAALHEHAGYEVPKVFKKHNVNSSDLHKIFIHTGAPNMWTKFGHEIQVADKIHHIGQRTGNIITASIPFGIADAMKNGQVERDKLCLGWAGSGGMVFSVMSFKL